MNEIIDLLLTYWDKILVALASVSTLIPVTLTIINNKVVEAERELLELERTALAQNILNFKEYVKNVKEEMTKEFQVVSGNFIYDAKQVIDSIAEINKGYEISVKQSVRKIATMIKQAETLKDEEVHEQHVAQVRQER